MFKALVAALLAWSLATASWADEVSPLTAIFSQPAFGDVSLSPSGRWLAATVPGNNKQRLELVVADLAVTPLSFKTIAWLKDYDIARVVWLNDKRLVFTARDLQAGELAGETGLWAADPDGNDSRLLIDPLYTGFRAVQPVAKLILSSDWSFAGRAQDGSDDVLVRQTNGSTLTGMHSASLYRLDTRAPQPRQVDKNAPPRAWHWITDATGRVRWLETVDEEGQVGVYRHAADMDEWQRMAAFQRSKGAKDDDVRPVFMVGEDLFVSHQPPGATGAQLLLWDAAHDAPRQPAVLRANGFDVGDTAMPLIDAADQRPLGWRYVLDRRYTRWTDETMAQQQAVLDQSLPGRFNEIHCDVCLSARWWLVVSRSDRRPPQYSVLDRESGRLLPLGSTLPLVPDAGYGQRSFQRITARDGRSLPVYLTRPSGDAGSKTGQPRPAVIYVHGGPASRQSLEWGGDPTPQFLAALGYVVVEPEFRGSVGYGPAHERAGDGQWGLAMQDDLQDALRWAVAQGLVDGRRVCIMGASYGGYAALMGAVRHPGDYRCAIAAVAPTDLPQLLSDAKRGNFYSRLGRQSIVQMFGGDSAARSPVNQVSDIKLPVLAAWGVDDRRVPIEQAREFRDAARKAQVDLMYVEYADEGHVWLREATRLDFYGRVRQLLARVLDAP